MTNKLKTSIIFAASAVTITLLSSTSAFAACVHTEWQNTMANHAIPTIIGRDCNGNLAVSAQGVDPQGQTVDFGWAQMQQTSADEFAAAFVGADATNNLQMKVHPVNQTMNVRISSEFNDGTSTVWFGHYKLKSTY